MPLDPDRYRLTPTEHQAVFDNDIKPDFFAGATHVERPVAVFFGGQPGAGKSAAVEIAVRELEHRGGAVTINADDLRPYHPQYAKLLDQDDKNSSFYTNRDCGEWVQKSIAHAKENRLNVIIDGTMRDGDAVVASMRALRTAGYEIDARALAVNERLSGLGVILRYENQKADRGTGRMVLPEVQRVAYAALPNTLERIELDQIADRVTVCRRGGEVIYGNELRDGRWTREPDVRAAIEVERIRPMNLDERRSYAEGLDKAMALMTRPDRHATPDEIKGVDDLRQRAKLELADADGPGGGLIPADVLRADYQQKYVPALEAEQRALLEQRKQLGLQSDTKELYRHTHAYPDPLTRGQALDRARSSVGGERLANAQRSIVAAELEYKGASAAVVTFNSEQEKRLLPRFKEGAELDARMKRATQQLSTATAEVKRVNEWLDAPTQQGAINTRADDLLKQDKQVQSQRSGADKRFADNGERLNSARSIEAGLKHLGAEPVHVVQQPAGKGPAKHFALPVPANADAFAKQVQLAQERTKTLQLTRTRGITR